MATIALGILAALAGTSAVPQECTFDRAAMLAMNIDTFDQSERGWRAIGEKHGCESKAVPITREYLSSHPDLSPDQRSQLLWHKAQLLALAGLYTDSIRVFRPVHEDDENQRLYLAATIAFLSGKRQELLEARSKLAVLPKPLISMQPRSPSMKVRIKRFLGR